MVVRILTVRQLLYHPRQGRLSEKLLCENIINNINEVNHYHEH